MAWPGFSPELTILRPIKDGNGEATRSQPQPHRFSPKFTGGEGGGLHAKPSIAYAEGLPSQILTRSSLRRIHEPAR